MEQELLTYCKHIGKLYMIPELQLTPKQSILYNKYKHMIS